MNHPTPSTYNVPIMLRIEADNRRIALAEAERIVDGILAEDRHLAVEPVIPASSDGVPMLTTPATRYPPAPR